jgi:hypothetical protein
MTIIVLTHRYMMAKDVWEQKLHTYMPEVDDEPVVFELVQS